MEMTDRYKSLMDNIPGVFYRCAYDEHWTMHHMSAGLESFTGYKVDEIVANKIYFFASLIHPDDTDMVDRSVKAAVEDNKAWDVEYRLRLKDGTYLWVSEQGVGVRDENGIVQFLDGFVSDISKRKAIEMALHRSEERVRELAYYDNITGLPNRNLILDRIEAELGRSQDEKIVGILYIDLDGFKIINDLYGHAIGDKVLEITGRRLSEVVSIPDIAARIGGDEFLVLCTQNVTEISCENLGLKIIKSIEQSYEVDGFSLEIGASVGVSLSTDHKKCKALISAADAAMYEVKKNGKGGILCTSKMTVLADDDAPSIESQLVDAIRENQFQLLYQPQVHTQTGEVRTVEALIRWTHKERGLVSPAEFIPVAEETGLIKDIGVWVLEEAIQQLSEWRKGSLRSISVSVNIAPSQFLNGCIGEQIISLLRKYEVPPTSLEIEVTESIFLHNMDATINQLNVLRSEGVRVAIDDFGTGYSCLSYLQDLPLDVLKIDRSFINRLVDSDSDQSVINTIVQLASDLDIETVAEGVETSVQLDHITNIGCNMIQGFYFARPCTADKLSTVINEIQRLHSDQSIDKAA